jgi:hypothetical protein
MGKTFSNQDLEWARRRLRGVLLQIAIDCEQVARRLRRWVR